MKGILLLPPQPQQQQGDSKPKTPSGEQVASGCWTMCRKEVHLPWKPSGSASHQCLIYERLAGATQRCPADTVWASWEIRMKTLPCVWAETSPEAGWCGKGVDRRSWEEAWQLALKTREKLIKSLFLIPISNRLVGEDLKSYHPSTIPLLTLATEIFQHFVADVDQER